MSTPAVVGTLETQDPPRADILAGWDIFCHRISIFLFFRYSSDAGVLQLRHREHFRVYDFGKHPRRSNDIPPEPFVTHENDYAPPFYSHDELAAEMFEPQAAKTRHPVQTRLVPLPLLPEGDEYVYSFYD